MKTKRTQPATPIEAMRAARNSRGISVRKLAAVLRDTYGVNRSFQWLSKVENGQAKIDIDTAGALSRVLGIPVEAWMSDRVRFLDVA